MNELECRLIYREAFNEFDLDYENRLFGFCKKYCRTLTIDDKTVAMLFAMPIKVKLINEDFEAYYVFAVATKKTMRGKGYMSKLMDEIKSEGKPLILKPSKDNLIEFYEKLGFKTFKATTEKCNKNYVIPLEDFKLLADSENKPPKFQFTGMYFFKYNLELNGLSFPDIMQ